MAPRLLSVIAVLVVLLVSSTSASGREASKKKKAANIRSFAVFAVANLEVFEGRLLDLLGEGGQSETAAWLRSVVAQISKRGGGVPGLSARRAVGLILQSDGDAVLPMVFLPVKDAAALKKLMGRFFPKSEDAGDSILRYSAEDGSGAMFLRIGSSWAYLCPTIDQLKGFVPDPLSMLRTADIKHDFTAALSVADLPARFRTSMKSHLQESALDSAVRMPGETESQFVSRLSASRAVNGFSSGFVNDGRRVTLGVNFPSETSDLVVDLEVVGRSRSAFTRDLSNILGRSSRFSGMLGGDAVLAAAISFPMVPAVRDNVLSALGVISDSIQREHQKIIQDQSDGRGDAQKSWRALSELTDSIKEKLGSAVLDTAMTLREGPPGRYTMVVALGLPDAKELSAWIGENWSVYKETGFLRKLAKPSTYRGLRVFSGWPAISSEGVLASVFGEEPILSIGVGRDIVYLAFGENGPRALREARDAVSGGGVSPKPLDVRMDLGLLLELFSGFDRSRLATFISRQLGDDTRLRASMRAVSGGVGLRMEFGPGFVPFLGSVLSNEIFPASATPSRN